MFGFGQFTMNNQVGSQTQFGKTNSDTTTNPFGISSFGGSPQFGASTTPSFGVGSTIPPAFGATRNPVLVSQSVFGVTPHQTLNFGQSTPMFGNTQFGATPSPFNTQSSSFGTQTPSTSAFGNPRPCSLFGTSTGVFGPGATLPYGGSSHFGQNANTGSFGFPASHTNFFDSFGSVAPFGQTSGGSGFGSTTSPALGFATSQAFGTSKFPGVGVPSAPSSSGHQNPFGGSTFGITQFGSASSIFNAKNSFGTQTSTKSVNSPFSFGTTSPFSQSTSAGSTQFATTTSNSQNFSFGTQTKVPANNNTGLVETSTGVEQKGSRVEKHRQTPFTEKVNGKNVNLKILSISGMSVYGVKSQEELRWEDYQRGDKGGANFAVQPPTSFSFTPLTPSTSNSTSSTFTPMSNSVFSSPSNTSVFFPSISTPSTLPAPTSSFPPSTESRFSFTQTPFTPTSFTSMSNSVFSSPSNTSVFSPSISTPSILPAPPNFSFPSFTQLTPSFTSSPSLSNTSVFSLPSNTSVSFPSTSTPSVLPAPNFSFPFTQTTSSFTSLPSVSNSPSNTSVSVPSIFSSSVQPAPSFSFPLITPSTSTFTSPNTSVSIPSLSTPPSTFLPLRPSSTSCISSFIVPQVQRTNSGGIPVQNTIGSSTHSNVAVNPISLSNPFGTLPALVHSLPPVQYGISSMPVADKATPIRISKLSAPRHSSQRRIRLPLRKYTPKSDDAPKIPFFMDDEEIQTLKANSLFIPRENPRSMLTRSRTTTQEQPIIEDVKNPIDENASAAVNLHAMKQNNCSPQLPSKLATEKENVRIKSLLPKLHRSDYYTEPRIEELAVKEEENPGFCRQVKNFTVGRQGYGYIKFEGETDVRNLDLDSIIEFNHREVIVYKDETSKPAVGHGLNKPAEVTLFNVWCINKKTGEHYTQGLKLEKFVEMVMKKTEEQGAEFVSFDADEGIWKFRVKQFSP